MEVSTNRLRKGAWTAEEDSLLRQCVENYGEGKWHLVPSRTGLNRCRKSCRLRWLNYLQPSIKRGKLTSDEVDLVVRLHKLLGNRWALIAGRIPGRTANDIKNYWNTHLSKKQDTSCTTKMGEGFLTGSAATTSQKNDVIKPQPQSWYNKNISRRLNGLPKADLCEISNIDDSNMMTCDNIDDPREDNMACNNNKEKYELPNDIMDGGKSMWWESMIEESGNGDVLDIEAIVTDEAGTSVMNSSSSMFDFEQLWSLFNEDTG